MANNSQPLLCANATPLRRCVKIMSLWGGLELKKLEGPMSGLGAKASTNRELQG